MNKVIEFKSKQNRIDELWEKEEEQSKDMKAAIQELQDIADGKKPALKSVEEAKEIWKRILKPAETRKEIAKVRDGKEGKSILEDLDDNLDTVSAKEWESGFLVMKNSRM